MDTLKTSRLILREFTLDDAKDMFEYAKDPNVGPNAGWKPHETIQDSYTIIRDFIEKQRDYAIVLKETNKVIGSVGLYNNSFSQSKCIGYVLNPRYWNNGYTTEAVREVLRYAFTKTDAIIVTINHYPFNLASKKVIQKCGFSYDGTLRLDVLLYNGKVLDKVCYSITKEEWIDKHSCYNLSLEFPTMEHKDMALLYRQEHFDAGEMEINGDGGLDEANTYEEWLDKVASDINVLPNEFRVPATTYFAVANGSIVGTLQIRHKLNEHLLQYGGHIGYGVAPSKRKNGYASIMLKQALLICKNMGIKKVLVTCDKPNIASAKTILKNGGVLENEVTQEDGTIIQRYIIKNYVY